MGVACLIFGPRPPNFENLYNQGYRNRYDIIDHEHEKKTFMYFFHRPIFAKIREFATIVLLNGIERFSESTLNSS